MPRPSSRKGIDTGVAATRGSFSEGAQGIANAEGVHLLDPAALEETVGAEDAHDLVEEYSQGSGGGGGSLTDRLPIPPVSLPSVGGGGGTVRIDAASVVAIIVVVAAIHFLGVGSMLGASSRVSPYPTWVSDWVAVDTPSPLSR